MRAAAQRPAETEYAAYYARYIDQMPEGDLFQQLRENSRVLQTTLASVDDTRAGYRYAEGKWSIREMLGHLMDAERIFVYRALRIARGDSTPLPGFEQNDYVAAAGSDARTISDLRDELHALRESTVRFFASLPENAWTRTGVASGHEISVRALARIVLGHARHHLQELANNYGVPTAQ